MLRVRVRPGDSPAFPGQVRGKLVGPNLEEVHGSCDPRQLVTQELLLHFLPRPLAGILAHEVAEAPSARNDSSVHEPLIALRDRVGIHAELDGKLPDVVLYPTGGGTGLIGMWKAFEELEAMGLIGSERPRMCVVQSDGCAPIVRAWSNGDERAEPWQDAATVAPGIRVPAPFADDLILQTLRESGGTAVAVPDEAIVPAMRRFGRLEGIDACPEGASTLIGLELLLADGSIEPGERIVLFNTGTGLKHPELRPGV